MSTFTRLRPVFALTYLLIISIAYASPLNSIPQPRPPGALGPNPRPLKTCVSLGSWRMGGIESDDCHQALELFRRAEGAKRGSQEFEFYAPGAKPSAGLLTLATPRKYTAKTCTIALSMLSAIPGGYLPPQAQGGGHRFAPTDVATLDGLRQGAREIVEDCVEWSPHKPLAGWQPMGLHRGLGVFIWRTGSFMDVLVQGGFEFDGSTNTTSSA